MHLECNWNAFAMNFENMWSAFEMYLECVLDVDVLRVCSHAKVALIFLCILGVARALVQKVSYIMTAQTGFSC